MGLDDDLGFIRTVVFMSKTLLMSTSFCFYFLNSSLDREYKLNVTISVETMKRELKIRNS